MDGLVLMSDKLNIQKKEFSFKLMSMKMDGALTSIVGDLLQPLISLKYTKKTLVTFHTITNVANQRQTMSFIILLRKCIKLLCYWVLSDLLTQN